MPRTKKGDKFFYHGNSYKKGTMLLGVNIPQESLTAQDLLDFLMNHQIDPKNVELPRHFITTVPK